MTFQLKGNDYFISQDLKVSQEKADSIMDKVMIYSTAYKRYIDSFEGKVYVKCNTEILKSNFIFWAAPDLFPFSKKNECSVFEILNSVKYEAPNIFTISPIAINTSVSNAFSIQEDITSLLDINLYSESSFGSKYIIPGSKNAKNKYSYNLLGDTIIQGYKTHIIDYKPIFNHLKLVAGTIYIRTDIPAVAAIRAKGRLNFSDFDTYIEFGTDVRKLVLPVNSIIRLNYNILNNISQFTYTCNYTYDNISIAYNLSKPFKKPSLDRSFKYKNDSIREICDESFWKYYRSKPLSYDEQCLIDEKRNRDSINIVAKDSASFFNTKRLQDLLLSNTTIKSDKFQWKYHGVFNPALIGFSPVNGFVLRQRLSYTTIRPSGRSVFVRPEVGYAFKSRELFYGVNSYWIYNPQKIGLLSFNFDSGNVGFSSKFIEQVNHRLDSTNYDFKDLNIDYYRDYHFKLNISREIFNGFTLDLGVDYNIHKPEKKVLYSNSEVEPIVRGNYADFTPFIRVSYTPFQPYRFIGKRKEYLETSYPIFSAEFARGIKGIMNSSSSFDRFEFDMHQKIHLRQLSFLSYRAGLGRFFNQKDEYFVRFSNFRRSNYPSTWNDNIGGVFNLLNSKWYYSSPEYLQFHVMYDSPFLFLYKINKLSRYLLSERVYISQLFSSSKPSYTELGYGIGNYIFNIAGFVSFQKYNYSAIGVKFTFELDKYW